MSTPAAHSLSISWAEGADHIITWLARTVTNTGVEPNSPASVAIPKLQEYTGGHNFDPVIGKYWE